MGEGNRQSCAARIPPQICDLAAPAAPVDLISLEDGRMMPGEHTRGGHVHGRGCRRVGGAPRSAYQRAELDAAGDRRLVRRRLAARALRGLHAVGLASSRAGKRRPCRGGSGRRGCLEWCRRRRRAASRAVGYRRDRRHRLPYGLERERRCEWPRTAARGAWRPRRGKTGSAITCAAGGRTRAESGERRLHVRSAAGHAGRWSWRRPVARDLQPWPGPRGGRGPRKRGGDEQGGLGQRGAWSEASRSWTWSQSRCSEWRVDAAAGQHAEGPARTAQLHAGADGERAGIARGQAECLGVAAATPSGSPKRGGSGSEWQRRGRRQRDGGKSSGPGWGHTPSCRRGCREREPELRRLCRAWWGCRLSILEQEKCTARQ
jgi:hypothetical protein